MWLPNFLDGRLDASRREHKKARSQFNLCWDYRARKEKGGARPREDELRDAGLEQNPIPPTSPILSRISRMQQAGLIWWRAEV